MKELKLDKQTMTLKEITDLLKVRHNDAMNTVTLMMRNPSFGACTRIPYSYNLPNGGAKTLKTYQLDKNQALMVAARLTKAPKSSKGFVYIIKCEQWYKIGKAKNVNSRLSGLQTGNPFPLELIHVIPCKDYNKAESYLHNIFANRRGLGEWFELNDNDIEKIKAIKTL